MGGSRWFLVLLLGIIFVAPAQCRMGYDVVASVNSSSWELHRSTQSMTLQIEGNVSGYGRFSKYGQIEGFAGIEAKDRSSSSQPAYLGWDEVVILLAREGPVSVTTKLKSGTNESINESVTVDESAQIEVEERWPTLFVNYKEISYFGPEIRTRENYRNNGDVVTTSINSWKLSKESIYEADINRTIISVNITPNDVVQEILSNKSSHYGVNLESIGSLTHLDVIQQAHSGDCASRITQDYLGEQKMSLDITMGDYVPPPEEPREWLDCCYGEEADREADKALECSSAAL